MSKSARFAAIVSLLLAAALLAAQSTQSAANSAEIAKSDWATYDRDYIGDRYSPLDEIKTANVTRLQPLCTYDSGVKTSFETGPVVVGGTLYFTTLDATFAIDAETCKLRWKHTEPLTEAQRKGLGVNRGVAAAQGKVFRGYDDGNVVAIDASSGKAAWSTPIANHANGETIPAAPLAWNGMVFIGNAGGDNFAVTGRVYALEANTGKKLWEFHVVPSSGPAAATWTKKSAQNPPTGGATWTSYHVDPTTGVLWVGTGNVAPDFIKAMHPGDNLYTSSVLAIDAKTGKLIAYIQPVKDDFHDWDMATAPALVTTRGGHKLAIASGKDGLVYGIENDVKAGSNEQQPKTLQAKYQTVATTRESVNAPLTETKFTRFCPGSQGGAEWNGPAYSPQQNLVYVPEIDWCTSVKLAPLSAMKGAPGQPWNGSHDSSFGKQDPVEQWRGWVTAIDADTGKVAWKYQAPTPVAAAVTATAGGLVFTADMDGNVVALDAHSGKKLWSHNTGQPVGGGIVSYEAGGYQRIAVAAGISSPIWPKQGTSGRIVVYGLK
ncbi:MAG TPA: PQQ-binding-like beta-propeller repeat protein [Clostridia bacterium]|nr:PQQ-binding-like beta-propeller repeat protein [Clostridia bacterium]